MTDEEIIAVLEKHCQNYDRMTGKIWMSYSRAKVIKIIREILAAHGIQSPQSDAADRSEK